MKTLAGIAIAVILAAQPLPQTIEKQKTVETWKSIGKQRITCYCPECNDGRGYESSSGKRLKYGYAACSWLPEGTKISIEGEPFEVVDICGTEAIDIFVDTEECECNLNEYRHVSIME